MSHAASPFRTVLVTRPAHQAGSLMTALTLRGFKAIAAPVLALKTLDVRTPEGNFDALAFTSANGVSAFAALDKRRDLTVFAVGEATAAAARKAQFQRIVTGYGGAAALADIIGGQLPPGARVLYPSARHIAFDLEQALSARDIRADRIVVYDMEPAGALPETALAAMAVGCVAIFFSARSLESFAALARQAAASMAQVVAVVVGDGSKGQTPDGLRQIVRLPAQSGEQYLIDFLERLEAVKGDL